MSMWEPFNEEARRTMVMAQETAEDLGSIDIAPDHIVIGVASEWRTAAARVLVEMGAPYEKLLDRAKLGAGAAKEVHGLERHFTPSAKRAIELAYLEARQLNHKYIGVEHLLLGILREDAGRSSGLLAGLGIEYEAVFAKLREHMEQAAPDRERPFLTFDHVQLAMPAGEEDRAREFYVGTLGMEEVQKPADLAMRGGAWFSSGTVQLHLGVEPDFKPSKKAHPALKCRNYDELISRLREKAVDVQEAGRISDGRERAFVADPFGNRIELIG